MTLPNNYTPKRYLHVGFHFNGTPKDKELEPIFSSLGSDWIRYSGNSWIIYTHYDSTTLGNLLKPYIGINDHIMVLELKAGQNVGGWLPQWIWDWINKSK